MFKGIFTASLDNTGRTTLPISFRNIFTNTLMDNKFVITNGFPLESNGECVVGLMIFPYKEWLAFEDRVSQTIWVAKPSLGPYLNSLPVSQRNTQIDIESQIKKSVYRSIISPAKEILLHMRGQLRIPISFRKALGNPNFKQKILFVGSGNHIVIWNADSWAKVENIINEKLARQATEQL